MQNYHARFNARFNVRLHDGMIKSFLLTGPICRAAEEQQMIPEKREYKSVVSEVPYQVARCYQNE